MRDKWAYGPRGRSGRAGGRGLGWGIVVEVHALTRGAAVKTNYTSVVS